MNHIIASILTPSERDILMSRHRLKDGKRINTVNLANEYGITTERLAQIEKRAMKRLAVGILKATDEEIFHAIETPGKP